MQSYNFFYCLRSKTKKLKTKQNKNSIWKLETRVDVKNRKTKGIDKKKKIGKHLQNTKTNLCKESRKKREIIKIHTRIEEVTPCNTALSTQHPSSILGLDAFKIVRPVCTTTKYLVFAFAICVRGWMSWGEVEWVPKWGVGLWVFISINIERLLNLILSLEKLSV